LAYVRVGRLQMSKLSDDEVASLISLWQNERYISHINSIVIKAHHSEQNAILHSFVSRDVDLGLGLLVRAYYRRQGGYVFTLFVCLLAGLR